ncbi:MAG: hypothetical protein QG602_1885 [Verrucomicrobiota bacterium]|nr:hypothetical protein [Verrucomicrobiota bacterium]
MNARSVRNNGVPSALTRIRQMAGAFTMAATLALTFSVTSNTANAQQTVGSVYGKVGASSTVTAESTDTGFTRTVTAAADGTYRIGSLPPGNYKVTYTQDGQPVTKEVSVSIGSNTLVGPGSDVLELEKFTVGGSTVNPIDFGSAEAVTIFNEKQIDLLPVARSTTAVALLAPGTTLGDSAFGNLASFGGASVAENAYYVNGMNITNFRNGLGGASVPFEFYNQFEVKTGGYSAEFGRSTGGVISSTTKSGSNEYHAGFNVYFESDAGRSNSPDVYRDGNTSTPYIYNSADYRQDLTANVYASGPVLPMLRNKLFFYGLYQIRDFKREDVISSGGRYSTTTSDDPFWGVKLDFYPLDNHHFEFTMFSDEETELGRDVDYNFATKTVTGTNPSDSFTYFGGDTKIARYTGTFFENLTVSAMWGESTQNRTALSGDDLIPAVYDGRSGSLLYVQGNPDILYEDAAIDTREAKRLDAEYSFNLFGSHRLRAGYDIEDNISTSLAQYSGGVYYRYYAIPGSGLINGVAVPSPYVGAVRVRKYKNEGSFQVKSEAWYVEDNWTLMNERLNLRLGLRNESFENLNGAGEQFIKVTGQKAPRIAAAYDLTGDKKTKIFANFGRYHLPIASNTNVRLAGGEFFTQEWYALTAVNNNLPTLGAKLGGTTTFSNGTIPDTRTIVDLDIKPMYQDEWIAGIQHTLNKDLTLKVAFTTRQIDGTAIDDMIVDHALTYWAQTNGFGGYDASGNNHYVLGNPGREIRTFWDFNEDGDISANEEAVLTKDMLGYPAAKRKYYAVEVALEKVWNGKWNAQLSYTWSQSFGNYEGWVLSDNGQDDAGITILFDTPDLTLNSSGYLANDRRHQFKAFGSYKLNSEWTIGANVLLASGRPKNKFGNYPDRVVGSAYGPDYFIGSRGAAGTMSWQFNANLSFLYKPKWGKDRVTMGLDVFNVLNRRTVLETVETFETSAGGLEPTYGLANSWQRPRYFRLSFGYDY